jgi:integrase
MIKTEEDVSMIITPKIQEALNNIADYEGKMPTNQECNRAVKAIAKKAKIDKLLTFHCARHTFGFICAEANMPIEVCARLMGHTNAKTTAVYYHISNSNADQWMMKLHS